MLVVGIDSLLLVAAWYSSCALRYNFQSPESCLAAAKQSIALIVVTKIVCFYFFDIYRGMWRYTSLKDLFNIIKASVLSSFIIFALFMLSHRFEGFARSILIIDLLLTILVIAAFRLSLRLYLGLFARVQPEPASNPRFLRFPQKHKGSKNLVIVGAGDSGEKIYREIRDNAQLRLNIVGFVDDDLSKIGKQIHGIPVLGPIAKLDLLVDMLKAHEILIAIPSATAQQMRDIVSKCEEIGLNYKTLPGMGELIDGRVSIKAIRDVAYRDLLGRELVNLDHELIGSYLEKNIIFITGAGGSIGSELCRQICRFKPQSLILYDQAESPLYEIELDLKKNFPHVEIIPLLANVRHRHQLSKAFKKYQPQVVFHAAAYKHVPMLEMQPWAAVLNNILGTRNVIEIAKQNKVDQFVFISTDKAVKPANIMGASKRISELLVQGQNGCNLSETRFMIVRFGNVAGSVGSVVPLFKKQIENKGPVTVTHPEVTRYFMTIPEACQLIIQAGAMGKGGEIFILDMGIPIKIADMARDLIRLSGFEPDVDIKIEYIGLRLGEKLYEELITEGENIVPTSHKQIMVLEGETCDQTSLNEVIDEFERLAIKQDAEAIRAKFREVVPEYVPAEELGMGKGAKLS